MTAAQPIQEHEDSALGRMLACLEFAQTDPSLDEPAVERNATLALGLGLGRVCVLPYHVARTAAVLKAGPTRLSALVGFPHGGQGLKAKLDWADMALEEGAVEACLVADAQLALVGDWKAVEAELKAFAELCREAKAKPRLMLRSSHLEEAMLRDCLNAALGAGFRLAGAAPRFAVRDLDDHDLKTFKACLPQGMGLVASGPLQSRRRFHELQDLGVELVSTPTLAALV